MPQRAFWFRQKWSESDRNRCWTQAGVSNRCTSPLKLLHSSVSRLRMWVLTGPSLWCGDSRTVSARKGSGRRRGRPSSPPEPAARGDEYDAECAALDQSGRAAARSGKTCGGPGTWRRPAFRDGNPAREEHEGVRGAHRASVLGVKLLAVQTEAGAAKLHGTSLHATYCSQR